jgi:maltooligosyltrehalose trehalohydrolase
MGEEYGEKNPFLFFTEFGDAALVEAVRKGRRAEFADFFRDREFPDPQSEDTFRHSCLSWQKDEGDGALLLRYYRALIHLRKTRPAMQGITRESLTVHPADGEVLHIERKVANDHIDIWMNFGQTERVFEGVQHVSPAKIFDSAALAWNGPGSAEASLADVVLAPQSIQVFGSI